MKSKCFWFHCALSVYIYKFTICFWLFLLIAANNSFAQAFTPHFNFTLENIRSPFFDIRSANIQLTGTSPSMLEVNLRGLVLGNRKWNNLRLQCDRIHITRQLVNCSRGWLQLDRRLLSLAFQLSLQDKQLELEIRPLPLRKLVEKWRLVVDWRTKEWRSSLKIVNGDGRFLFDLFSQKGEQIQVKQIRLNGDIQASGSGSSISTLLVKMHVSQLSFNDASSLHAGEQVGLHLNLNAYKKRDTWLWRSKLVWSDGEIFWQPFYFRGEGHQLIARGAMHDQYIHVAQAKLSVTGIGETDFSTLIDIRNRTLQQARLSAKDLVVSTLFADIIRPLATETALAETEATGRVDITWRYQGAEDQSLIIGLQDVSLIDMHERFAVEKLNMHLPWNSNEKQNGVIQFGCAQILGIPLGATTVSVETKGMTINVPHVEVPVLDGELQIRDLQASLQSSGWQWQFNGQLLPVSMERLTESLQIQPMFGYLSGTIPKVSYINSTVTMEGELVSGIFDGVVVARNLVLTRPFSMAPHLAVDVAMHHIDLDMLTRAYSFGNMQGRVDVMVNNLELSNWEPVKFDAKLVNSTGDYKRRISQAAVKNLIALGGSSAISMIQSGFLGMFEQFRYSELGWGCKLRGHICYMSGIESSPSRNDKGYILVKGSGIPAITITGYNAKVDWYELLRRLEQAVESGAPVIH